MDAKQSPDDLLDETALCEWVGTTPAWARKNRLLGRGPKFIKLGHLVRYRRGDVQAWLDENTFVSTTRKAEPAAA